MDSGQILSWVVTVLGLTGFHFAGKRVWWSWYINLGCQALWFAYAYVTSTPAFAVSALFFTFVFGNNARKWTKDHFSKMKEADGNTEKKVGNSGRPSVHWWERLRHGPNTMGPVKWWPRFLDRYF